VQKAAHSVGAMFLLIGVLSFIPAITTHYDQLSVAGHHCGAALLGVFHVSVWHDVVHLLFGVAGIALARTVTAARAYLIGGAVIYVVVFVCGLLIDLGGSMHVMYGLTVDNGSSMNAVPINTADTWLHLGLGLGMLALGSMLGRTTDRRSYGPNTTWHTQWTVN
jgi:hypothetical protein